MGSADLRFERKHHEVRQISDALMALQDLPVEEAGFSVDEVQVAEVRVPVNQGERTACPIVLQRFALLVNLTGTAPY